MPLIEVKVFKDELDKDQSAAIIAKITNVVVEVTNERIRPYTWVIINEVKNGQWGAGGKALSLSDIRKITLDGS
ncbi:tautomerase family protein [Kordiimonas aquimaris]|uniref:tautomerase family protein n=1 Tax=Kordiimonas aquimaris TaxID=707591 RepID=UPI0021CF578C|nr:4-oxalocrotonate tautomerase family protein [Kordiimonas aquimaris]